MPNPDHPITDEVITVAWGDATISRLVLVHADMAAANAYYDAHPPEAGQRRVIVAPFLEQTFTGGAWVTTGAADPTYGFRDPRASWGILASTVTQAGDAGQVIPGTGAEVVVQQSTFAPLTVQAPGARVLWVYGSLQLVNVTTPGTMVWWRLRQTGLGGPVLKEGLVSLPGGAGGTIRVPLTVSFMHTPPVGPITYAVTVACHPGTPNNDFRVTHPCGLTVNDQGPAVQAQAAALVV